MQDTDQGIVYRKILILPGIDISFRKKTFFKIFNKLTNCEMKDSFTNNSKGRFSLFIKKTLNQITNQILIYE